MTEPKKRPRRRRPKPENPLPVEHPQRWPEGISWDTTSIRVTPPPVGVPCVDFTANPTGSFANASTTRINVTFVRKPPTRLARAHALMLRLSAAWDRLAARLV